MSEKVLLEKIAKFIERQCAYRRRGEVCPNSPCEADRLALAIRERKFEKGAAA